MAEDEKTKDHPGGLGDKADEEDPKMFATGETNCQVCLLKKVNPGFRSRRRGVISEARPKESSV